MTTEIIIAVLGFAGTIFGAVFGAWKIALRYRQKELDTAARRLEESHSREIERLEHQAGVINRVQEWMTSISDNDADFQLFVRDAFRDIQEDLRRLRSRTG